MSSISVISPAANPVRAKQGGSKQCSGEPGERAPQFDDVMNRALSQSSHLIRERVGGAKQSERESAAPSRTKGRGGRHGSTVRSTSSTEDEADDNKPQPAEKSSNAPQTSQIAVEALASAAAVGSIPPPAATTGKAAEGADNSDSETPATDLPATAATHLNGDASAAESKARTKDSSSLQNLADNSATQRSGKSSLEAEKQATAKPGQDGQKPLLEKSAPANSESQSTAKSADPAVLAVVTPKDVPRPEIGSPPSVTSEGKSGESSDSHGISSAQQDAAMRKGEKMPNVADPAEKVLPGKMATMGGENLPIRQETPARNSRVDRPETITANTATSIDPAGKADEASAPATSAMFVDPRARSLERTHDMVALHAMRLRDSNSDSLHVVIKPGAGLQLSLDLRQRDGGVEVQAVLERGDFEHLNKHWAELQQRLEARGVRLGSLSCPDSYSNGSHNAFQQRHRPSGDADPLAAGAFAEFAFAGSMTESVAPRGVRAKVHRGWETWA